MKPTLFLYPPPFWPWPSRAFAGGRQTGVEHAVAGRRHADRS